MTKTIIIGSIALIALGLIIYFIITPIFLSKALGGKNRPGKPKLEVPVTHQLGWWAYQDGMEIDTFEVKIVKSQLNLFNNKSMLKYRIVGKVKTQNSWRPEIGEIHISERFVRRGMEIKEGMMESSKETSPEAIIELTPVVIVKDDKSYKGEVRTFDIANEYILPSYHWGSCYVQFKCGKFEKEIKVHQSK